MSWVRVAKEGAQKMGSGSQGRQFGPIVNVK